MTSRATSESTAHNAINQEALRRTLSWFDCTNSIKRGNPFSIRSYKNVKLNTKL